MLEKDDYGLNSLFMVKQQKLQAFHRWLHKQKTQEFDLNDVNILSSFDANAMATILAEERQSGTIHEHGRLNKGTQYLGCHCSKVTRKTGRAGTKSLEPS